MVTVHERDEVAAAGLGGTIAQSAGKKLGVAAFVFFFVKGLAWLLLALGGYSVFAG